MPAPLPIESLNHLSRQCRDVAKSQSFYCDVLGFRPIQRPNFQFPGAWLCKDGLQVHLIGGQEMEGVGGPISSRANHVAFGTLDLEAVEQQLIQHGVPYKVNIQSGTGNKQLFFHDPDGHTIEIAVYPAPIEYATAIPLPA